MRLSILLPAVLLGLSTPVLAEPVHILVAKTSLEGDGRLTVDLLATNDDASARPYTPPNILPAVLSAPNRAHERLTLTPATPPAPTIIPSGGFVRMRYRGELRADTDAGLLSLAVADAPAIALQRPASTPMATFASATPAPPAPVSTGTPADNPFLPNLSAYEPIYFVYGPGIDTSARIQISFKYRLFGGDGGRLGNVYFAYTQRMFWDLEANSAPFRDVNYMPELMYLVAPRQLGSTVIGGRIGARHESNGRDGAASRSVNTLYVQPEASWSIGGETLTLGPRLWAYVGRRTGNEDIARYRGHTGLYAAFGDDEGLRLSLTSRLNPGSGKGAVDATLSYPLTRIWARGPELYLIAQGFSGYGEDLLDYNRHQTRARIGFGVTR